MRNNLLLILSPILAIATFQWLIKMRQYYPFAPLGGIRWLILLDLLFLTVHPVMNWLKPHFDPYLGLFVGAIGVGVVLYSWTLGDDRGKFSKKNRKSVRWFYFGMFILCIAVQLYKRGT